MEWLSNFCDFQKATSFCRSRNIFRSLIPENRYAPRMRVKVLFLQKNHRDLKNLIFFVGQFAKTFLIHQRTIIKMCNFGRVGNSLFYFLSKSLFLCLIERNSNLLLERSQSLFCKEWFALGHKNGKSSENLSKHGERQRVNHEQITHVTLFERATRAIHSRLVFCIFCKER